MPWTIRTQASSGNGGSVEVGSTGRISTLMMQELEECVKRSPQSSSSSLSRRKLQAEPVSVHCGALPRKPLIKWRRKTPSELSSSGNGGFAHHHHHRRAKGPRAVPRAFGHHAPMLRGDDEGDYDVEGELDVKCGNLLSGRLSKLGFSKLSGSAPQEAAAAAASSSSYSLRRLSDLESQFR